MNEFDFSSLETQEPLIDFLYENINFELEQKEKITAWIEKIIADKKAKYHAITYIFCDDSFLHQINMEYLNHDTYTDIISFDYSEKKDILTISGDLFISIERIKDNAQNLSISFEKEVLRVMIHGILHLLGYKDESLEDEKTMRKEEEKALELFEKI